MTINKVIERVAEIKDNAYSDEVKAAWISAVDGRISLETMHMAEPVVYAYPEDGDVELLVPAPYDNVYELYVSAMIDFFNREYDEYNSNVMLYIRALEEFKTFYIRRNMPPDSGYYTGVV